MFLLCSTFDTTTTENYPFELQIINYSIEISFLSQLATWITFARHLPNLNFK